MSKNLKDILCLIAEIQLLMLINKFGETDKLEEALPIVAELKKQLLKLSR